MIVLLVPLAIAGAGCFFYKKNREYEREEVKKITPRRPTPKVDYVGSLLHYYDSLEKTSRTIPDSSKIMFNNIEKELEWFLCNCDEEGGLEVQKLLITAFTARNCLFGLDDSFPRDERIIEVIFEEIYSSLAPTIGAASLNKDQNLRGQRVIVELINVLRPGSRSRAFA